MNVFIFECICIYIYIYIYIYRRLDAKRADIAKRLKEDAEAKAAEITNREEKELINEISLSEDASLNELKSAQLEEIKALSPNEDALAKVGRNTYIHTYIYM